MHDWFKCILCKNKKYCELCKCENEDLYHVIECKIINQDNINKPNPGTILEYLYCEDVTKIEIAASQIE